MCSVWELREHGVPFEKAIELLDQARSLGATVFTPCGAESFMRKDFLDIVEHAHRIGFTRQDIVTNGTMITDAHLDRLQQSPSVALHISIDGPREIHDLAARRGQLRQGRRHREGVHSPRHRAGAERGHPQGVARPPDAPRVARGRARHRRGELSALPDRDQRAREGHPALFAAQDTEGAHRRGALEDWRRTPSGSASRSSPSRSSA